MFTLSSTTYLDKHTKEYSDIIIINRLPPTNNKLYKRCKRIIIPQLSPFKSFHQPKNHCTYAITEEHDNATLITPNDIPDLFSFLIESGFQIKTDMTQMMQTSNVQMDNNLLCFITL